MVQRLHKLSPLLFLCLFVVPLLQGERGIVSRSAVMLSRCRPEGMWCDADLRMMAHKIFLAIGGRSSFAHLVFYLCTVPAQVFLFHVDAGTMLYRVDSDVHLQTNENW